MAEQRTFNPQVLGSSPRGVTNAAPGIARIIDHGRLHRVARNRLSVAPFRRRIETRSQAPEARSARWAQNSDMATAISLFASLGERINEPCWMAGSPPRWRELPRVWLKVRRPPVPRSWRWSCRTCHASFRRGTGCDSGRPRRRVRWRRRSRRCAGRGRY